MEKKRPRTVKRKSTEKVDLEKRDEEFLLKAIKIVEELLNSEGKPICIIISRIASVIGEKALLEKNWINFLN